MREQWRVAAGVAGWSWPFGPVNTTQEDDVKIFGSDKVSETDEQQEPGGPMARLAAGAVDRILAYGIDGFGPLDSVEQVVRKARAEQEDPEKVIDALRSDHVKLAAGGGFVTGVGGLITMPVALPANVVGFYVLAARMVSAVALVRGYDVHDRNTRTALSLTLIGADADALLKKAGVTGGGRMARIALNRVPRGAAMMINKGLGFRVATQLGTRMLGRLGRVVPLVGGAVGAGLDGYLMGRLADHARTEFPPRAEVETT